MPRIGRGLADNSIYHVLNRGNGRQEVFHTEQDYEAFMKLIVEAKEQYTVTLYGYCLMPNHFHRKILLRGRSLLIKLKRIYFLKIGKGQLKGCRVKHVWIHPEHSITCRKNNIKIDELYYGGRRRNVSFARAQAAHILIEDFGITLAEVARNLGVTTSAIFNMLKRKNDKFD